MADADRQIPDPGLSLSEAVSAMGHLRHVLAQKGGTDHVLLSAWDKIRMAANEHAQEHPEQLDAVSAELDMEERLGRDGQEKLGG